MLLPLGVSSPHFAMVQSKYKISATAFGRQMMDVHLHVGVRGRKYGTHPVILFVLAKPNMQGRVSHSSMAVAAIPPCIFL